MTIFPIMVIWLVYTPQSSKLNMLKGPGTVLPSFWDENARDLVKTCKDQRRQTKDQRNRFPWMRDSHAKCMRLGRTAGTLIENADTHVFLFINRRIMSKYKSYDRCFPMWWHCFALWCTFFNENNFWRGSCFLLYSQKYDENTVIFSKMEKFCRLVPFQATET